MKLFNYIAGVVLAARAASMVIGGRDIIIDRDSVGLQDIVTFDEHSIKVYGERLYMFSGEFHPYRLPVTDLFLDVFQKIKSLGFNCVSFYVDWALLEGQPGTYSAEGIFALEPFFEAAKEAGIYLLARPGPYINAEVSGGGFPGWLQRVQGQLRTRNAEFLAATDIYMANVGAAIAKAQITNGGPIILVQPENEYTGASGPVEGGYPDPVYFAYIKKQLKDAGIVVPLISNDASPKGTFAPGSTWNGTQEGNVDIYGHDAYPVGFDCANPTVWPENGLPTNYHEVHEAQSPSTLFSIVEFQGGAFDPWGGLGFAQCSELVNHEFERVYYKNNFASGATFFNIYMIFGGTNWGNLGHAGGYTSYDYGSSIAENREIYREKYSEVKLQANFMKVSPALLTASVDPAAVGVHTDSNSITTTPLFGNGSATNFYIVRHADYRQTTPTTYKMSVKTSQGTFTIPQIDGELTLSGRDSKFHVTDYDLGGTTLLYSSAEIFTWKRFEDKTVLVVYGGPGEQHELSVISQRVPKQIEGSDVLTKVSNGSVALNWKVSTTRQVAQIGDLFIYMLDRNTAYNLWVPDFVRDDAWGAYTSNIEDRTSVIVQAGYLIRTVYINGPALHLTGDANATTPIKVIGAPSSVRSLHFNDLKLEITTDPITGEWTSTIPYTPPEIALPDLTTLDWKYIDSLPEISPGYDDSLWTLASKTNSTNPYQLRTPTSLFGSDYGYHTGVLVFRGSFVAAGNESTFAIQTQGGSAFGSSVWLNSTYVGSWTGNDRSTNYNSAYTLPNLAAGKTYVFTVVVDNMGLDENWVVGPDEMKHPRGILSYDLSGRPSTTITWKLTGNLGGEEYIDKVRGPLNEGGLYVERQGFTQPYPPNHNWVSLSPSTGSDKPGVSFYQASFSLDLPKNYDIPISFAFGNGTTSSGATANYRAQLYVNGYQYGKYVNNVGPQSVFPVTQGVLNYHGTNWIGLLVWGQEGEGVEVSGFSLEAGLPVWTSIKEPKNVPTPDYRAREGAY
ncbi:hypothetical protein HYFRA_00004420 [Hymenoscyphus fraxineus]|uniref:Beta-galactosidase n=1 Tax=Hymenoscyphus fraxineus TaxID=746836 RepID=A0A9N9KZW8_9HELO|nr:hypothetical protein HYFRA_00004420 [Hymenoscyphus fraxineus]